MTLIILLPLALYLSRTPRSAEASWWGSTSGGSSWVKRQQLNVVNNSGDDLAANTTIAVTINTKYLVSTGKLQSDCDDLRVVYQSSTTTTELDRYISYPGGGACATSEAAKVYFSLQSALANAATSTSYYMYYSNQNATAPSNPDYAFDIGDKEALLVCPFDGTTTCAAGESPSIETGAIRYSGSKSAISFDGKAGDRITDASGPSLNSTSSTIEMWINPQKSSGDSDQQTMNLAGTTDGDFAMQITDYGTGYEKFNLWASGGRPFNTIDTTTLTYNKWSHIAITYDLNDSKYRLYVNGLLIATSITFSSTSTGTNWDFGNLGGGNNNYAGLMDEVRISHVVRYTGNFTPQTSPFVRDEYTQLLYHFDENGDDPRNTGKAIDDSGNGNHGTITGAKYVAGLVGVNASTTDTGKSYGSNAYAGHEGISIEDKGTNSITNPSFEHSTYNTNWTAGGTITATENSIAPYYKFGSKSAKLTNGESASTFLIPINSGSSDNHIFSANVYNGTSGSVGGAVDSTVAKLVFNGSTVTPTFLDEGGGWWRLYYKGYPGETIEYGTTNQDSDQGLYTSEDNKFLSQGFQVTNSGNVDYVALYLKEAGTVTVGAYLKLEIQTDSGGVPSGTAVTNGTSPCLGSSGYTNSSYVYHTGGTAFKFTSPPTLTASTQYHLVLKSYTNSSCTTAQSAADATNYFIWGYDNTGSYADGDKATYSTNTSTWTTQSGKDHIFFIGNYFSQNFGLEIQANKTVYTDGAQLELKTDSVQYTSARSSPLAFNFPSTYFDGSLGDGYSWSGAPNNSSSTRASSDANGYNYMVYGSSGNIDPNALTVSFWFKPLIDFRQGPSGAWSYGNMLFKVEGDGCGSNIFMGTRNSSGTGFYLYLESPGGSVWSSNITDNWKDEWHHISVSYNSSGSLTLYLDGVQRGQDTSVSAFSPTGNLYIGGATYSGCTPGSANSVLSDLRIHGGELTTTEVTDLYYSSLVSHSDSPAVDRFNGTDEDPVAIYHFDPVLSATTVYDSSVNGNNLTIYGATPDINTSSSGDSVGLRSLKFDGTNDIASSSAELAGFNFGTGSFSVSSWFRHSSTISDTDTLISQYGSSGYKIYMNNSGFVCAGIDDDSTWGPDDPACSTTSYADSRWHHVEMVKGSTTLTLFVDGSTVYSKTITATGNLSTGSPLFLGADNNNSNYWDGFIDEVYFYEYARSAEQIKTDYLAHSSAVFGTQTSDSLSNGLVGHWKMDECSADTCPTSGDDSCDSSGNVKDGAWNGNAAKGTGKFGNGVTFDGTGDYIEVTDIDL